jgi:hypothetical protein
MNRRLIPSAALGGFALLTALAAADTAERITTNADRQALNLTVYNGGIALVHDTRRLELHGGLEHIAWRDVGAQIQPVTALLESKTKPGSVRVVEQNFDYDVLQPSAILDKYVGREVTVVHDKALPGQPQQERAKLLSTYNGIVLQYANRIETSVDGRIVFPALPSDLRDQPTLVLDLAEAGAGTQDLDLSYITGGLTWRADYVGVVNSAEDRLNLNGLITLSNQSGTSFNDARLQLVAGNVNIVNPPSENQMRIMARPQSGAFQGPQQIQEQSYFEYHLYTLSHPTSVLNKQTKQVSLLSAHDIPLRKTLEMRGGPDYYRNAANGDLGQHVKLGVYLTFTNKGGDLGIPLPGGIVRLYKNDEQGTSQFLGSDNIDHTPRNEDVRLHVGDSFDVTANRKQTNFHIAGPYRYDSSYEFTISNAKTVPQDVLVVEPIPAEWTILSESSPHEKSSSNTATWHIRVPADGKTTLTFTVEVWFV